MQLRGRVALPPLHCALQSPYVPYFKLKGARPAVEGVGGVGADHLASATAVGAGVDLTVAAGVCVACVVGALAGAGAGVARQVLDAPSRQEKVQLLALTEAHKGSSTMYSSTIQKSGSRSGVQLVASSTAFRRATDTL